MTDSKTKNEEWLTISEISKKCNITRQAVYVAIKKERLKARQVNRIWFAHIEDIDHYRSTRYNREYSKINGEPIFDVLGGYLSVNHLAKLLGEPSQRIYYLLRTGQIPAFKRGAAWVVSLSEVKQIYDKILDRRPGTRPGDKSQLTFA